MSPRILFFQTATSPSSGSHFRLRAPLLLAIAVAVGGGDMPGVLTGAEPHRAHGATKPALGDLSAQPESTRRMVERLRRQNETDQASQSPFHFDAWVKALRTQLDEKRPPVQRGPLLLSYAQNLLAAGESEAALREFENYERLLAETGQPLTPEIFTNVLRAKAVACLRIGERANCLANHNADSCLLPIQGGGVHTLPQGSRDALIPLSQLLRRYPGDLGARWLLNIAYMTLGEYPEKVPPAWLIPPETFESDYNIKRFPDVAGPLGLDIDDLAGGVVMDDFDRDGLLDLLVSAWGLDRQVRFFRNNGDGSFTERTKEAGLLGITGGLNLVHADYDNDGYLDIFMLRGAWLGEFGLHPNSLLRNNGDGTFTDVTEAAGVLSFHPTQTAVWFDYNGDGHLDLFVGNETEGRHPHPCELYRNNGDGTFTECAAEQGVALVGYVKAVVSGDFNNDGRPDLLLSRRDGVNHLLRNDGPAEAGGSVRSRWRFTDVARAAGIHDPMRSFAAWFWDYDNDGWLDVAVSGYFIQGIGDVAADHLGVPHPAERMRVYRNLRDGTFADVSREMKIDRVLHTMGANFGDLDNDGWLDFYAGTGDPDLGTLIPSRMFRNDAARIFQDVTTSGGFGQLQKGHGIAFGDLDNDGDQDIYSVVGGALIADNYHNQLFANPGHGNRWLTLALEGERSNRAALGARINVVVSTETGERSIHRVVGSGASFGASPLRQEIGLGRATGVVRVEIAWPVTGETQVISGLELDRFYKIREGAHGAEPIVLPRFDLSKNTTTTSHQHHE